MKQLILSPKALMPKPFYKHKILFDENVPERIRFPHLNEHFDIKHISHDLNKAGIPDDEVYALAVRQKRIIVTFNWRDFIKFFGTDSDEGLIAISGKDWHKIDTKLTALLKRTNPKSLAGKYKALMETKKKKSKLLQ